jgi:hypothetical protein
MQSIQIAAEIFTGHLVHFFPLKIEKIEAFFFNTIAQFTKARSIHSAFYQGRMIEDNQKMFIPSLAIENDFCFIAPL